MFFLIYIIVNVICLGFGQNNNLMSRCASGYCDGNFSVFSDVLHGSVENNRYFQL